MKLFYHISQSGNFGDDINQWLWYELLPDNSWSEDDNTTFIGIGTIFDEHIPDADKNIILGTGIGYAALPALQSGQWNILSVRGPITAEILNLDKSKIVTDSAIAVASIYNITPKEKREHISFMPHISSAAHGIWERACKQANIQYLDPRDDSKLLIEKIAKSKLVLSEAMHGAIVADAMRVPWLPIITNIEISAIKWLDWAMAMSVDYRPVLLPQSCLIEWLNNLYLKFRNRSNILFTENTDNNQQVIIPENAAEIAINDYNNKFNNCAKVSTPKTNHLIQSIKRFFFSKIGKVCTYPIDQYLLRRATKSLKNASQLTPYLSNEEIHQAKLDQTMRLIDGLK